MQKRHDRRRKRAKVGELQAKKGDVLYMVERNDS